MFISIVIIVKNDRGIDATLESIFIQQTQNKFEVIVVDVSGDRLFDIRDKYSQVNWISYSPKPGKKHTIPEQRNMGISSSKGEIIVFIDASCIAQTNWLDNLVQPILDQNEHLVAGRVKSHGASTLNDLTAINNNNKKYLDECPTINLAFKKDLIEKIGNFDETFDYGSDVDFSWRVIDAGFKVRYAPEALISHDWGSTKNEIKRNLLYGQARARLYKKHKKRLFQIITKDQVVLVYPLFILGLPLMFLYPLYILILPLLVLKNIREPKPVLLVTHHLVYGLGVLAEVFGFKI